jgi:hypothetical protein
MTPSELDARRYVALAVFHIGEMLRAITRQPDNLAFDEDVAATHHAIAEESFLNALRALVLGGA